MGKSANIRPCQNNSMVTLSETLEDSIEVDSDSDCMLEQIGGSNKRSVTLIQLSDSSNEDDSDVDTKDDWVEYLGEQIGGTKKSITKVVECKAEKESCFKTE